MRYLAQIALLWAVALWGMGMFGRVKALITVLMLFYINVGAKVVASVNSPAYNSPQLNAEKLAKLKNQEANISEWTVAPSNPEFAFKESESRQEKILELKSLHSGNVYTIYKSSLVASFSKIKDVSPDGRSVIFEVASKVEGGHVNQTHVLAFNRDYGLTLADGSVSKTDTERKLTKIAFDAAHHATLSYADSKGNNNISKSINIGDGYGLSNQVNDVKGEIVNFYGGALAIGAKVKPSNTPNQYEVEFSSSFTSGQISKHRLDYDPQLKAIVLLEEINKNNEVVRKTKFNYNGFNYLTETYNADGELIYCKASIGKPSIDVISNYLYLKAELEAFYANQLPMSAKVFIDESTINVDMGATNPLPLHCLRFAYSFDRYSDYGFSSLTASDYKGTKKTVYTLSRKSNRIPYETLPGSDPEKVVVNHDKASKFPD